MSDDLITIYGQTMKKPVPIEPMTSEELELSKIPQARVTEFEALKSMCEISCRYSGFSFKEYGYCSEYEYYSPFTCNKDAAHRVCRGKCSQYVEYMPKKVGLLEKILWGKPSEKRVDIKDYLKCFQKGYYTNDLKDFDWFRTDKKEAER